MVQRRRADRLALRGAVVAGHVGPAGRRLSHGGSGRDARGRDEVPPVFLPKPS